MTCRRLQPPSWEFLLTASRNSLQSFELSRLAHASNLRKEIAVLLDEWVEETSAAMLARWLIEQRERPSDPEASAPAGEVSPKSRHSVSYNVFADRAVAAAANRGPV